MKLNKKGYSFIDVIVAMVLLSVSLLMIFQFLGFLKTNKEKQDTNIIVLQLIQNETEKAYRTEDWSSLTDSFYEASNKRVVQSSFHGNLITEHNTEQITLTISVADFEQSVLLERRVNTNDE